MAASSVEGNSEASLRASPSVSEAKDRAVPDRGARREDDTRQWDVEYIFIRIDRARYQWLGLTCAKRFRDKMGGRRNLTEVDTFTISSGISLSGDRQAHEEFEVGANGHAEGVGAAASCISDR